VFGLFFFGCPGKPEPESVCELPLPNPEDCDRAPLGPAYLACLKQDQTADIPVKGNPGCLTCHTGIEDPHPTHPLPCTTCHGGDGEAITQKDAHVALPDAFCGEDVSSLSEWAKVLTLKRACTTDELDAVFEADDGKLLQWINPGDLRVATRSCGDGAGSCHQATVDSARRSVMQTFTGHYNLPRFLAGMQDREAVVGTVDVTDPHFSEVASNPLAVEFIEPLRGPEEGWLDNSPEQVMDEYLPRHCPACHTASFGKNDSHRNYRSSGCTACHMIYDDNGRSQSGDPTVQAAVLTADAVVGHPVAHVLTQRIPTRQCEHCHFQGARIGLNYQGLREHGFGDPQNPTPEEEKMTFIQDDIHGHGQGWYVCDEDNTNSIDETPPDIHHTKGMHCVDCHTDREVHGDGHIYSTAKGQLDIHCIDCHGTVREPAKPNQDGQFVTRNGTVITNLSQNSDGSVILTGRIDGREHAVTQVKESLDKRAETADPQNDKMLQSMGVVHAREDGSLYSHADTMECWTCHTKWRLNCWGCHVKQDRLIHENPDFHFQQINLQTGQQSSIKVDGQRFTWDIDGFYLGTNDRGMIDTMCPSMQMFFSAKTKEWDAATSSYNTTEHYSYEPRRSPEGKPNFGWMPTFQHTTQRNGQTCQRCHPKTDGSNETMVRATYGFGNGVTVPELVDETGVPYDLSRMLDDEGNPISEFGHEGTGPVSPEVRQRAMQTSIP